MPHCCSVPRCNGNYRNGQKVTVFSFPKEPELLQKWIRAIKRDFQPTAYSKVCELHFTSHDIIRETSVYDEETGRTLTAPLKFPRLREGAIPSVMPNSPHYLSKKVSHRETPEDRMERKEQDQMRMVLQESLKQKLEYDEQRRFSSLEELQAKIPFITLPESWVTVVKNNFILFLKLSTVPAPVIDFSVVISDQLILTVNVKNIALSRLGNKFTIPLAVADTNTIDNILEYLDKFQACNHTQSENINDFITDILSALKSSPLFKKDNMVISFLEEQIALLGCKKPTYSCDMLVFSTLFYTISPHAYRFVRSSGNIRLPHPVTIQRLCLSYNFSPGEEQNETNFLKYVKYKTKFLKDQDKIVNLMLDEIHVKPFCDYKGGDIVGMAYDSSKMASSAHVFMISSVTSTYKDVVHILPVKSLSYVQLHCLIQKVILGLEDLDFKVISVITDNNAINRKAMSQFSSPPSCQILYPHPADSTRPLFYVIDPVHLLKSIRNNWLNQKNDEKSMYFPDFPDKSGRNVNTFQIASLSALRKLVHCEGNSLLKFSYSLTLKSLSPSNLERQNVNLVLKVFNNFVIEALLELGPKYSIPNFTGTAAFIKIICTWWNIMNVKSKYKGARLNDDYKYPLTNSEDDVKFVFLNKFLDWLDMWEKMNCDTGRFTKETHTALKQTTYAITEIVSYCQTELGLSYILPGKFQTDQLESRFSLYRQLSGGQYHVSLRQIFETEKKLRMQTTVSFSLQTKAGPLNITDRSIDTDFNFMKENLESSNDFPIIIDDADIQPAKEKIPVIVYVGGYTVYSVLKRLNCVECRSVLQIDKDCSEVDDAVRFTMNLDRGQLLIPSPVVVDIVMYAFIAVSKLCSEFDVQFLKAKSHKNVAASVIMNLLESEEKCFDDCCPNGHESEKIVKMIVCSAVNILLNNYCKERVSSENVTSGKKRKLQTLS